MDNSFVPRIKTLVEKLGGQSALARKTGLSLGAIQRYLKGGEPSRTALIRLARAGGVSMNWLVYGLDDAGEQAADTSPLPLYGFGDSAGQGWYGEVEYGISAALDWPDPDVFAVVANDRSLVPEGIRPGHVCMVSPNTRCREGDIVFMRREDGKAALKVFERDDAQWYYIKGYIDPEDGGGLIGSAEKIRKSAVIQVCPVIYVKRRA